jgi:transcriptional regulator with XRE-family HTH domain
MELRKALREMVNRRGMTLKSFAEAAGYKTSSAVTTPIKANDMKVSTLIRLANAAGYELKLVYTDLDPEHQEYPIRIDIAEDQIEPAKKKPRKSKNAEDAETSEEAKADETEAN